MNRLSRLLGTAGDNERSQQGKSSPKSSSSPSSANSQLKGFGVFPFVNGTEERAVLAFSHLHGNEHVPPMLVRLLTFMRSSLQGKRVETVGGKGISSPSAVCTLADGRTLIANCVPEGPALFSPGGVFVDYLSKDRRDFKGCNGVCQLDSGNIVATDSANGRIQLFALSKDQAGGGSASVPVWVSCFNLKNANKPATAHLGKVVQVEPEVVAVINTSTYVITTIDCRDLMNPFLVGEYKNVKGATDLVFLQGVQQYAVLQGVDQQISLLNEVLDASGKTLKSFKFSEDAFETSHVSSTSGQHTTSGGNRDLRCSSLSYPSGLATTKDGKLVIADQGNKRLLVYDPQEEVICKVIDTSVTSESDEKDFGPIMALSGLGIVPQTGGVVVSDKIGQKIHYFV